MTRHFTKDNFKTDVLESALPVMVDFWASWCGPCKTLGPVIDEIATETDGKAVVGKLNIDDERDLAIQYRVMSIPTVLVFRNGQEVGRLVGVQPKAELIGMLGV